MRKRKYAKLQDAISSVMLHASSRHHLRDFEPELRLLISASRAFSCAECRGTGKVHIAVADTTITCDVCRSDRKELEIYG